MDSENNLFISVAFFAANGQFMKIKKMPLISATVLALALSAGGAFGDDVASVADSRDGKKYRTVKIGKHVWMAENLNYKVDSSYCYDDLESSCAKYGRLYVWGAAKTACPLGWHLPSREEWGDLAGAAGDKRSAGKKLKAKAGWEGDGGKIGGGDDALGFSALPGGLRRSGRDTFSGAGNHARWWSATETEATEVYFQIPGYGKYVDRRYGGDGVYYRVMDKGGDEVYEYETTEKRDGFSVRCVKN